MNPNAKPRVAVDLGGTKILAVVEGPGGPAGPFLSRTKKATNAVQGREAVLTTLRGAIDEALDTAAVGSGVAALGVCVPGIVHPVTGVVSDCSNLPGWGEFALGPWLSDHFGVAVTVVNDARAATWAEFQTGAGSGVNNLAFLTLSTGIGGGFVFDGRLYQGTRGVAGEWGEMRDDQGLTVERSAAGSAVERLFGIRAEDLRTLHNQGDPRAQEAFQHLVTRCGRLMANVATLVDPDIIVIGGGLSQLGPWLLDALQVQIRAQAYSLSREVKLVPARWGDEAGVRGVLGLLPASNERPLG